jgi:hypothetical protein
VVPKTGIGIAFCTAGVPGRVVMVKVKAPSTIAEGISRLLIPALRKSVAAIGKTAKVTTKSEMPP